MNRSMLFVLVVTVLTVAGCKKEETSAPESAHAAAPSQAASPDQPSPVELPVAEDFEAEAEREITEDNYEAALDALAKEIEASGDAPRR